MEKKTKYPVEDYEKAAFEPSQKSYGWLIGLGMLVFIIAALFAPLVLASEDIRREIRQEIADLLPWVGEQTGYPIQYVNPIIVFKSTEDINRMYFGEYYEGQDSVIAVTENSVMYLNNTFSLETDIHVLVHELVHVLQWNAGVIWRGDDGLIDFNPKRFRCYPAVEGEAYEVEYNYEKLHDLDTENSIWMMMFTQCPFDY